jgi:superfamily II DNA/RNA helicase
VSVETIEQRYFSIQQNQKFDLLLKLLEREQPKQAIIFCRTKRGTDRLQRDLSKAVKHIDALANAKIDCIHGDMNQRDRDRVFGDLRAGKIEILVATDVVGRGIDVSTVSHIINFDMPLDCDDYVHRVGRTGRMGREGIADSMGDVRFQPNAYYGAQTQRAVENFPVSGWTLPPALIQAMGLVKYACAVANRDLGKLTGSGKTRSRRPGRCDAGRLPKKWPRENWPTSSRSTSSRPAREPRAT